jgi:hypothetical protein
VGVALISLSGEFQIAELQQCSAFLKKKNSPSEKMPCSDSLLSSLCIFTPSFLLLFLVVVEVVP